MTYCTWQHIHRHEWGSLFDRQVEPNVAGGGEQVEGVQGEAESRPGRQSNCTSRSYEDASPARPCRSTWPTAGWVH